MSRRTLFGGLLELEPGDGLFDENADFTLRNIETIARMLRVGAVTHRHDGHAALADPDPAAVPTLALDAVGGQLPPGVPIFAGYTLLDADGGETLISALVNDVTPFGLTDFPAAPTAAVDYTAGTLPANTYYYVLTATDGAGGETDASDPATAVVVPGQANARVVLDGLMTAAAAVGGVGWRLYRSTNGGQLGLLGQGATEGFTDDGQPCLDPQLQPPVANNAGGTGQARITVPGPLPADAAGFRLYVSPVDTFDSPALVGEYLPADAGTEIVVQSFGLQSGSPPPVSTTLPGAAAIGGGGGGTSYPADYAADLTTGWDGQLDVARVISGAGGPALLREGTGEWSWGAGSFRTDNDSSADAGHVEHPAGFFAADAPGMSEGHATVKFQLDAVNDPNFLGNVAAFIGHRDGPRSYTRVAWDGAGTYYIDAGVEDPIDNDNEGTSYANAALALAVDTDYWLRVTRIGTEVGGALYDVDPDANPAAVPLLEAALTDTAGVASAYVAARTNGFPGFGWSYTDDTNRANLIRFYGLAAQATNGGDGFDPLAASRIAVLDNGSTFSPVRELEFVGFGVVDQRPRADRMTISVPGMHWITQDGFGWAGALGGYLTQNIAVDNSDVKANAAGDDARAVMAPAPGWWTLLVQALFVGVAADDKFGVMVQATDIDSYLLVRVNNDTAAPALEIVDVNNGVETILKSVAIAQIITGAAANYWDVADPVWVAGEFNNGFVGAAVYDMRPDFEMASPMYRTGVRLTGALAARYAIQGGYGVALGPDAGGGNTLRATELATKTGD
jgi:hypothetical protein